MDSSREPLLPGASVLKQRKNVASESLSYDPPTNKPRLQQHKAPERRHLYGYTGHTAVMRVSTIVSGVLIGITAVAIQTSIEHLVLLRNGLLQQFFSISVLQAVAVWVAIGVAFVVVAGMGVQLVAPKAAGAGVTLVMAFLNGNDIPGLLSLPVFLIKILGLICSRVAGLAVGPEGPMVHLGACIASMVCIWEPWLLSLAQKDGGKASSSEAGTGLAGAGSTASGSGRASAASNACAAGARPPPGPRPFKNADHRELVSAGAAAGIAAAFGAPIGGVLFSLEEAATHWSRKVGWRCFLCTTCASFTLAQLHPRSQSGMLSFKAENPLTNQQWLMQAPFVVLVSVCGGLLGAVFNVLRKRLWPIRASRGRTLLRLAEAAGVALATVGIMALLSLTVGSCLPLPETWIQKHAIRMTCRAGYYNDLATAFLASDVWVIRTLLNLGAETLPVTESCSLLSPCYFSWPSLATLCASYLLLMVLASSLCVPGGLFMPSIMVGGSFGALFGFVLLQVLPSSWDIQPGVYALLCATAVLGGVFRSTFSLVVIVVEGTKGIDFLFGIIMAILVSNLVASRVLPDGVYESELERDGNVYYLRPEAPNALRSKTAEDMMATPVVGVEALVPVAGVRNLLAATTHNGFPVYSTAEPRDPGTGMGRLDGFILRTQLEVLLRRRAYCSASGEYLSPPTDVAAYEAQLNQEMRAAQATVVMQACPPLALARAWGDRIGGGRGGGGPRGGSSDGREEEGWAGPLLGGGGQWLEGQQPHMPAPNCAAMTTAGLLLPEAQSEQRLSEKLPQGEPALLTLEAAAAAAGLLASPAASVAALDPCSTGAAAGAQHLYLNLAPFMDCAPLAVRAHTLGAGAHHLFLAMSLRHLCVVDARNHVVGIITRKDLDHAAGEGWWRINQIAPHPHHELKRHQSWLQLAMSLSAPRRLLSSIQAALSPITSPLASRKATPTATPRASPVATPRSSDLEAGDASPFWQSPETWAKQARQAGTGRASVHAVAAAVVDAAVAGGGGGGATAEVVTTEAGAHGNRRAGSSSIAACPGDAGRWQGPYPVEGAAPPFLALAAALGAMDTIAEDGVQQDAQQAQQQVGVGEPSVELDGGGAGRLRPTPRVRAAKKKSGLEAFGSIALHDDEEGEGGRQS